MLEAIIALPNDIFYNTGIATYLDDKCSKIDTIIAKQEKIIEKIKLYKSSLIMELVLGGLHAGIHMKDSGYDFISKLTEYKKSLIYECVTGKKEII